jgi:hypothetical protein
MDVQGVEFGPAIPVTDRRDICRRCGIEFEMVGDNCLVEDLCPPCQAKFRVEEVLECRKRGQLPAYYNWWTSRGM